jgi:hypothetical protein
MLAPAHAAASYNHNFFSKHLRYIGHFRPLIAQLTVVDELSNYETVGRPKNQVFRSNNSSNKPAMTLPIVTDPMIIAVAHLSS